MKKLNILALLFVGLLAINGVAFGWGSSGGDGSNYGQLQETAVFFNNSGGKLIHGQAVVIDLDGTGVTAGTTLGSYVETLASADSILVVGCVKHPSNDQTPVVVVTKGPIDALASDSTDAVTSGSAVGTSAAVADSATDNSGRIGGGADLGIALEAGSGSNEDYLMIWVNPTGAN